MKQFLLVPAFAAFIAAAAAAQTVTNCWDFATSADVVGSVATSDVGTPDLSINTTYGEAYAGAGNSLNTTFNVQNYLIADVHNGVSATALDFGTGDFSFSYWTYNDTTDGNSRGPRIFDFLDGTSTGVQIGTTGSGVYNLRVDTSDGGASISNNPTLPALVQPADQWVHVAVNVDRTNTQYEIFFNGTSQGIVPLSSPNAGNIAATRDMDIGLINSDGTNNQAESAGLDDLAFYDGLLSSTDIVGLAAGTLTPLDFLPPPVTDFCFGDDGDQMGCTDCPCGNNAAMGTVGGCLNSAAASARLLRSGSDSILAADLRFEAENLPPSMTGLLISGPLLAPDIPGTPCFGQNSGFQSPAFSGLRCAVGNILRHGARVADASGMIGVTNVGWGGADPFINFGAFVMGTTQNFQIFYRDDAHGTCTLLINTTQASQVMFTP